MNTTYILSLTVVIATLLVIYGTETEAKFQNVINVYSPAVFDIAVMRNRKPVVVFFASEKCGLCNSIRSKLEATALDEFNDDLYFAKVDTDKFPELMEKLGISKSPTTRAYIKGVQTDEVRGLSAPAIRKLMERIATTSKVSQRFNKNKNQG